MEIRSRKDESFWKVLSSAIELDHRKGHLKWTMTELSRKSGVTRSLIYYYFGRSKLDILKAGVKLVGEDFVGLNERRMSMWKEGRFFESLQESHEMYERAPYLCSFYLNYRNLPNEIGESLRDIEKTFLRRIKQYLPTLSDAQVKAVFSVYFGIIFSPVSNDDVIQEVIPILAKIFGKRSPYMAVSPRP